MNAATEAAIWTVSGLNREVKTILERGIGTIWIEGEISNFSRPASGHWYFSLKDSQAQIRAAMFRNRNQRVAVKPENGMQVLVRAQTSLYEARGEYQLIVEHLEAAGSGQLMQQFEQRKQRLLAEGLFATEHKQALPSSPQKIGVITSATGAALRDVLHVLRRRAPWIQITVFAAAVQGEQAPGELLKALLLAQKQSLDALLLVRGGGSMEDLWAFNDESLVRAVFACPIPLICGVGHETDFTLCDFVADERAPTPSAAAERISPDQYEIRQRVDEAQMRLLQRQLQLLLQSRTRLEQLQKRLLREHPLQNLKLWRQQLKQQTRLFGLSWHRRLQSWQQRQQQFQLRLQGQNPAQQIAYQQQRLERLLPLLLRQWRHQHQDKRQQLGAQVGLLDAHNPLQRLHQGYCRLSDESGQVVRTIAGLQTGQALKIQLADGQLKSRIESISAAPIVK